MTDLDELDLLLRRVMNVIGHELRTPVTTVRGLADSLAIEHDEATRAALAGALVRSAVRLEHLVDDLLLASGVFTAVPIGPLVDVDLVSAVRRAGWTSPIEGTAITRACAETVDRIIDPIVDNARRYGEPIEARISDTGERAVIDIESSGPEMGEGDVALLCEPFFRGERAVTTAPGLGLGLAIARTLARAAGGDVHAHARAGGGLVTRIELPRGAGVSPHLPASSA
ncbi:MAG: two-component system, OmpR family, phosphate regulon sensor histidine kinase PhoR [Actinomycetota bacterium]|nr:two-component system, OmpR family, phosphate regulon sensor histidine kinase PhoR [Actinomycetota bacterium]